MRGGSRHRGNFCLSFILSFTEVRGRESEGAAADTVGVSVFLSFVHSFIHSLRVRAGVLDQGAEGGQDPVGLGCHNEASGSPDS